MANRYLLVNVFNSGVYAWDTQTDTAYSGNPVVPASYKCTYSFMAMSGDGTKLIVRGGYAGSLSNLISINTSTLAYATIPNNYGTLSGNGSGSGTFLATNNDGSEIYAAINDAPGTPQLSARIVAINTVTGNIRATTGYAFNFSDPQRGVLSYAASTLYTAQQKVSTTSTFGKVTIAGMTYANLRDYADSQNFETVCGLSADGTILYAVYKATAPTYYFVGIRVSDGLEIGRYTFSHGSVVIYPVLSPDRTRVYLARAVSPYQMVVLDLSTFTVIRQDTIPNGLSVGSWDQTGRYIYYGSSPITKYDTQSGTYQTFTFGSGLGAVDTVLTPIGFPFTTGGGGSGPATPNGLAWDGICRGGSALISWNASTGATQYTLLRDGQPVYIGPLLQFTDSDLTVGATYTYTVMASNGSGTSAASSPVSVVPCNGDGGDCCNWTRIEVAPAGGWGRIETPCSS